MPPKAVPIKQQIFKVFTKHHGLSLKADASRYLEEAIRDSGAPTDEVVEILERVAKAYLKLDCECLGRI